MKRLILAAMLLGTVSGHSIAAGEFVTLNLHGNGKCELAEFGSAVIPNPYIKKGKSGLGCVVEIPMKEFTSRFEICALSGYSIAQSDLPRMECGVTVDNDKMVFMASSDGQTRPLCSFICKKK